MIRAREAFLKEADHWGWSIEEALAAIHNQVSIKFYSYGRGPPTLPGSLFELKLYLSIS